MELYDLEADLGETNNLASTHPERVAELTRMLDEFELTASEDRDWLAGTPWHKHVRARVEAL